MSLPLLVLVACPGATDSYKVDVAADDEQVRPGDCETEGICSYSDPAYDAPTGYRFVLPHFCRGDAHSFVVYPDTFARSVTDNGTAAADIVGQRLAIEGAWTAAVHWFMGDPQRPNFNPVSLLSLADPSISRFDGRSTIMMVPGEGSFGYDAITRCFGRTENPCHTRECVITFQEDAYRGPINWSSNPNSVERFPGDVRFTSLILIMEHEFGHVLGLGHPAFPMDFPGSIMNTQEPGRPPRAPSADDFRAALSIYGP